MPSIKESFFQARQSRLDKLVADDSMAARTPSKLFQMQRGVLGALLQVGKLKVLSVTSHLAADMGGGETKVSGLSKQNGHIVLQHTVYLCEYKVCRVHHTPPTYAGMLTLIGHHAHIDSCD